MIKRGRHLDSDARDEFTRKTLHGGVDQILASKTPINIEVLLVPERIYQIIHPVPRSAWLSHLQSSNEKSDREGKTNHPVLVDDLLSDLEVGPNSYVSHTGHFSLPIMAAASEIDCDTRYQVVPDTSPRLGNGDKKAVRFVLVEGPPEIGKSTFAWEMCRRWDEIETLRNYHAVVLLKLREKWVLNATKLSDLFRYPPDPELSAAIAKDLNETHGQNLLLVLDGFDEVSHSFHENSVMKSILCRQLLPKCTIILTTRPSAKHTLESVCQPRVGKHVEIIGFTEEERVRYITEAFIKEPELQVNFLKYMFLVPHIKSMMYIPLNCAIIAQVYYESQQSSHHLAIPRTRTQLYKALTHSHLVRHMKMNESNREYLGMLPEGLSKEDMEKFKVLSKFAFNNYHTGASKMPLYQTVLAFRKKTLCTRKVTFFKEDIPEGLVHFGFMNESTEMYAGKGVEQTFSFLHLSLQEYLAAWYLAHSYSIEFQVAYHKLAVDDQRRVNELYKGSDKEEEALISSLAPPGESLMEPALFLSGITGLRSLSKDNRNHWENYLSYITVNIEGCHLLLHSLYEAQNKDAISHYFTADTRRRKVCISSDYSNSLSTPYDCYAVSYCLAHSAD